MPSPAQVLAPYRPGPGRPWDGHSAAHLLRRAGFGPAAAELQRALAAGPQAAVAGLVAPPPETGRAAALDALGERLARRQDVELLRGWWLMRLVHTRRPLVGRMALFWHDHFATSFQKVRDTRLMLRQLRLFERHALGSFPALLKAVARDPAMILWLDGNENVKGRPNENFARELLELFTLGEGNYTEEDVREAARAFTGWHARRGRFVFDRACHDSGRKRIFGRVGPWNGDDVIRLALERPQAARFLAGKLVAAFVGPGAGPEVVAAVAARLRETGFHVGRTLETLLQSAVFFAPPHRRRCVKAPVPFVVGLVRALEGRAPARWLARAVTRMGQALFEPPTVAGWPEGTAWLDPATVLARLQAARALTRADRLPGFRPERLCERHRLRRAEEARRFAAELLLDGEVPEGAAAALDQEGNRPADALAAAARLYAMTPCYQLA